MLTGGACRVFNSRSQGLAMLKRNPHATPVVDALTYYVDLMNWLFEGRKLVEIDARPSDSIVLALQQKRPIHVARVVFEGVEDMSAILEKVLKQQAEENDEEERA